MAAINYTNVNIAQTNLNVSYGTGITDLYGKITFGSMIEGLGVQTAGSNYLVYNDTAPRTPLTDCTVTTPRGSFTGKYCFNLNLSSGLIKGVIKNIKLNDWMEVESNSNLVSIPFGK